MTSSAEQTSPENAAGPSAARNRRLAMLGGVASILAFALALWFLYRVLDGLTVDAVVSHIKSIPVLTLAVSIALAISHFSLLTVYDAVALRYLNSALPYGRSALTAFIARAVGDNVGVATLSGSSMRQRIYSQLGLPASEVTRLIAFISVTVALGVSTTIGLASLFSSSGQAPSPGSPLAIAAPAGVVLLAIPVIYLTIAFSRRTPVKIGIWEVSVPSPKIALAQLGVSCTSILFATATLYVLLAPSLGIGFPSFLLVYLLAMAAGRISGIPGGIGVFETVLFLALPNVPADILLGTVVVYRCIAYVAPLIIASSGVLQQPGLHLNQLSKQATRRADDWLYCVKPRIIGTLVFLAGLVLLVSGASPPVESRWELISSRIPLLELSHLLGGIVGAALLVLARGLSGRLRTAYLVAVTALLTGVAVSLLKGLDYTTAVVLGVVAIVLYVNGKQFYRRGMLTHQRFPVRWITSIVAGIGFALWVGLISYRSVDIAGESWLELALDATAPGSLRAVSVAAITAFAFLLWTILSRKPATTLSTTATRETESVCSVLLEATRASANLALLGDKRFLWSEDGRAFLMYQVSGDSWVAIGDPVGPPAYQQDLIRAFLDRVKCNYGRPAFYQVGEEQRSLYVDIGLTMTRVAEEARVKLGGFSLQDSRYAELNETVKQIRQHGFEFEIVPKAEVPSILAELRRVSDGWIADKYATEKRFSLGSFSEDYIASFDCAIVKIDGTVAAFANIWQAPAGKELALDLLRYTQLAPKGIMDYLFVELMSWGQSNAYAWFNFGMAPLAGDAQRPLAPLWHRLDNVICTHSDNFYDLEELRKYKQRFDPVWQPRYLASPTGWRQLPGVLLDTSRMISGGVAGMFARP